MCELYGFSYYKVATLLNVKLRSSFDNFVEYPVFWRNNPPIFLYGMLKEWFEDPKDQVGFFEKNIKSISLCIGKSLGFQSLYTFVITVKPYNFCHFLLSKADPFYQTKSGQLD